MNMRRFLFIVVGIIVLLLVGVGAYILLAPKGKITGQQGALLPGADNTQTDGGSRAVSTQDLGVPLAGAGTEIAPRLIRITDRPVALGSVAVYVPAQKAPATTTVATGTPIIAYEPDVRAEYVERETGNIYAYQAHARALTRLTNKTLPGIQEATWLGDGSQAYLRFVDGADGVEHIATYALPATGGGGYFLEQDLSQVLAKGTSTIVTLLSTTDGSSAAVSSPSGAGLRTLFTSPISALRVAFLGGNYLATTKASGKSDGYAFQVDAKSGAFTRLLGPLNSLTTLPSPLGNYILYSYLDRGRIALGVLDLSTHTATRLPLATLPEKCAWTSDSLSVYCGVPTTALGNTEPDDWYQGVSSYSDRLWKIDLAGRVATLVIDPKQAGNVDIDMEGLALDRTNDVLIFTDKRTGALYAYDL